MYKTFLLYVTWINENFPVIPAVDSRERSEKKNKRADERLVLAY